MTDLFRGYDLTTVADKVAESAWTRLLNEARDKGFEKEVPEWADLGAVQKLNYKTTLLPIITDVLDALESEQVKPTEGRQMVPYAYDTGDRDDPRWYENQEHQHSTETATVWALHLHPPYADKEPGENFFRDRILERMSVLPEPTGEFTFGDSWTEWGEPAHDEDDLHMVVYFHATPDRAKGIGMHLANHAAFACYGHANTGVTYAVSTSGDYAEQLNQEPA